MLPIVYSVRTPRLVIRCWRPADAPLLKAAIDISIDHLLPWMPWATHEPTDLATKVALIRRWRAEFDTDQDYVYGIFSSDEAAVLGGTGLHARLGKDAREIGYWVRADAINQGIATETAAALTRIGFDYLGLNRMEIHCDARNVRSAAVPRKLGYIHEGNLRRRSISLHGPADSMIWTMFADEYPACPAARMAIEAFDILGKKIDIESGQL